MTLHIAHYNDHFLFKSPFGLARYGRELVSALRQLGGVEVHPVGAWTDMEPDALRAFCAESGATLLPGGRRRWILQWHFLRRPRLERAFRDFDVLHVGMPGYVIPTDRPTAVTIHDLGLLTHPHYFAHSHPSLFSAHVRSMVRNRDTILCVSRYSADEFRRLVSDRLELHVVHEAAAETFHAEADPAALEACRARYGLERPFFLSAGAMQPRKNLQRLCQAFASLVDEIPHDIVLVGARGWDDQPSWEAFSAPGVRERFRFLGFVPDEDLANLYRLADAFVFPSLFEGFGLPAVEAMACGCPVIASNVTSLPEVVGDAGILVDPRDVGSIRAALRRIATEPALRGELSARGRARSSGFRWSTAATHTREILEALARRG